MSYLFVIASLLMMSVVPRKPDNQDARIFEKLKEGFAYTFRFTPIKNLILLLAVVNLVGMSYSVLMPVFAKSILNGGSDTYGFLMGASGLGALASAFYLASRSSVAGLDKYVPLAAGVFGLSLVAIALTPYFIPSMVLMIMAGFGMMLMIAASNTILQTIVDDDKRGRVMSFYTMAIMGTAPFGSLLAGSLADGLGTRSTLILAGVICVLGTFLFLRRFPAMKKEIYRLYARLGIITGKPAEIKPVPGFPVPPEA